ELSGPEEMNASLSQFGTPPVSVNPCHAPAAPRSRLHARHSGIKFFARGDGVWSPSQWKFSGARHGRTQHLAVNEGRLGGRSRFGRDSFRARSKPLRRAQFWRVAVAI